MLFVYLVVHLDIFEVLCRFMGFATTEVLVDVGGLYSLSCNYLKLIQVDGVPTFFKITII